MDTQGEWVSLVEGSQRLGISIQTLRRKVKKGEVEARQVTTSHGLAWQIKLLRDDNGHSKVEDLDTQQDNQEQPVEQPEQGEAILKMIDWLRTMQEENRNLAGQVGFYQSKLQQLEGQLALAQGKILMLEAPKAPESPPEAPEMVAAEEEGERATSAPWWRLWWRRVVTG